MSSAFFLFGENWMSFFHCSFACLIVALASVMLGGCGSGGGSGGSKADSISNSNGDVAQTADSGGSVKQESKAGRSSDVELLVRAEEAILALTPRLKMLNSAAMNLQVPFGKSKSLFASQFWEQGIGEIKIPDSVSWPPQVLSVGIGGGSSKAVSEQLLWPEFFGQVKSLGFSRFYLVDGAFNGQEFETTVGFECAGKFVSGVHFSVSSYSKVKWGLPDSPAILKNAQTWQIKSWVTESFDMALVKRPLFSERMEQVIADSEVVSSLAESQHDLKTIQLIRNPDIKIEGPYPFHFVETSFEHPAIAVTDLEDDGLDDFYLTGRYSPNRYFRNKGDGTFEECGAELGLDVQGCCTAVVFFDFDNDGDKDAFVGRARQPALFLVNENGKFVDRTEESFDFESPSLVSAASVADYDGDGLLDLYLSTYSPIEGGHGLASSDDERWPDVFLNPDVAQEFRRRSRQGRSYVDVVGPPNYLLKNTGGKFIVSDQNAEVGVWRKTLHSGWSDFDKDGDQDLYVCNDFAPDDFFLNDGSGTLKRANESVGFSEPACGMGVAWGDHNNDGFTDAYISNMYSKAGKRITREFSELNPDLAGMAAGNYLYEGSATGFRLVSGSKGHHKSVAKAGWSWGGQFADIDNDGFQDLHVAAGYYTAPQAIARDIDL